ncbi:MAG: GTPase HflX, partial [Candidatus Mariimomonas ferrooxydans]
LMAAFRATLEELKDADLLIHVVDISNPRFEQQMESVEKILSDLELLEKPVVLVFNKEDLMVQQEAADICKRFNALSISAFKPGTFHKLLGVIEARLWPLRKKSRE